MSNKPAIIDITMRIILFEVFITTIPKDEKQFFASISLETLQIFCTQNRHHDAYSLTNSMPSNTIYNNHQIIYIGMGEFSYKQITIINYSPITVSVYYHLIKIS